MHVGKNLLNPFCSWVRREEDLDSLTSLAVQLVPVAAVQESLGKALQVT